MNDYSRNLKVLVVAAHSDDEVLGCGGTLMRHLSQGDEVRIIFLTNGVGGRGSNEGADVRKLACKNVMNVLGVSSFQQFDFPDNQLDTVPLLEIVQKVEQTVFSFKPDIIYTHYAEDLNIDHRICSAAVSTACRPLPISLHREIFGFEINSSTEWSTFNVFKPSHHVNIEGFLDQKIKLMGMYENEIRDFPHPRSCEAIRALAKWRGATAGFFAAEAFTVMQSRWL